MAESWPLLITGGLCVALAFVFAAQQTDRTLDHLSPSLLFFAVGVTGIVGGIASFAYGPDEAATQPQPTGRPKPDVAAPRPRPSNGPETDRWTGRPVPDVVLARQSGGPSPRGPPRAGDFRGVSAQTLVDEGASSVSDEEPQWTRGRLLRLTEEGSLTVYSVDDALRDLELVTRVIHARRVGARSRSAPRGSAAGE